MANAYSDLSILIHVPVPILIFENSNRPVGIMKINTSRIIICTPKVT